MLISHKHHFIFIHIIKNAGTSISAALLPFTAYNRIHLFLIRMADSHGLPLPKPLNPRPMEAHTKAQDLLAALGREKYEAYFSFAVVRNPWDWQVSLYTFASKGIHHRQHQLITGFANFDEYIRWRCKEEVRLQKSYLYSVEGEQLVDFIGRYENLDADFQTICRKIGVAAELPILNVSGTRPYREYYTPATIALVRETFAPDIEAFQYTFD